MGVLQSQLNSALTGLTFLAQQTPLWQRGRDVNIAKQDLKGMNDAQAEQGKALDKLPKGPVKEEMAKDLAKAQREERTKFLEEHKTVLPKDYAMNMFRNKHEDLTRPDIENMFAIRNAAQESAQARDTEIRTIDTNMTNYIETIKQMRAEGIIKSNKQMKGMIYRAGKGDEN